MLLQHEGYKYKHQMSGVTCRKSSWKKWPLARTAQAEHGPSDSPHSVATIQPFFYIQKFTPTNNSVSSRLGTTWKFFDLHQQLGPYSYCLVQMWLFTGVSLYLQMLNHSYFIPQNVNFRRSMCSTGSWMLLRT